MVDEVLRKTEVIRYFKADLDGNGAPIPGTEDEDVWVDVERLTGFTAQSGRGVDFRRESWELVWDPEGNEREIEYLKIRLHVSDSDVSNEGEALGDNNLIVIPMPTSMVLADGYGVDFQRQVLSFDNSEDNEGREITVFRIMHAEFDGDQNVNVTQSNYIDSEVIITTTKQAGAGVDFQREVWNMDNSEVPLTEDLPSEQYRVSETPPSDPPTEPFIVWPSHREEK